MSQVLKRTLCAYLLAVLASCSGPDTLKWEESVVLPDGRVVVLKREQRFDKGGFVGAHSFAFQHPVTGQTVSWNSDAALYVPQLPQAAIRQKRPTEGFFRLAALFMVQEVPHILVAPTFGAENEQAGCPYPSMFIFKYLNAEWQQVPYEQSPVRVVANNTTMDPKSERNSIKANQYKLSAGQVSTLSHPVGADSHGINLDRSPAQTFQCPAQKRFDFK